jgi:hypothetical protein
MKSLLIIAVLGCSILIGSSGVSADVIDTGISITLEDVVSEAAFTNIVGSDVMVLSGTHTYAIEAFVQPILFVRKEGNAIKPNLASPNVDVPLWEYRHYRTGIGKSAITLDTNLNEVAYRFARDGLITGKASA